MNKRGHYGLIELDATNLPKWLLYPLIFLICSILLVVTILMIIFIYSFITGKSNFIPFGFGYPMMGVGLNSQSITHNSQFVNKECFINGKEINCSNFNGDEHFCNNGICEMNGVCEGSIEECLK